ncbi:MAG: glycosyltransferase family 39 protein [Deltaproteobacteria bacterium]
MSTVTRGPVVGRSASLLWIGLACAMGAVLRLHQLPEQVLVDDEWHAVHTLLRLDSVAAIARYLGAEQSIPLVLFDRIAADWFGLSEWIMRLPSVVFGVAAVGLVPWAMRRWIGSGATIVLAWILAVSPILIFYSRYARPYSITLLLSTLGILAFYTWWTGGARRWKYAYIGCAIVSGYFHLASLPGLLVPLAFAAVDGLVDSQGQRRSRRDLARVGLFVAAGLGLVLARPLFSQSQGLLGIVGSTDTGRLTWQTLLGTGQLFVGASSPAIAAAWVALLVGGLAIVARKQSRWAAYLCTVALGQLVGVILLQPVMLQIPIVFARYNLDVLPLLLCFVAAGVMGLLRWLGRRANAGVVGLLVAGVLLAAGPLDRIHRWPNNFTNHASYQADYTSGGYFERFRPAKISPFYHELAEQPRGSLTILEAPWYYYFHPLAYYQAIHGQNVKVGFVAENGLGLRVGEVPLGDSQFAFRNAIHIDDRNGLERERVDYIVLHKDVTHELPIPFAHQRVDISKPLEKLRGRYGAPVYEDDQLFVFRVVRRGGHGGRVLPHADSLPRVLPLVLPAK